MLQAGLEGVLIFWKVAELLGYGGLKVEADQMIFE